MKYLVTTITSYGGVKLGTVEGKPGLSLLQALVGGPIQQVPGWNRYRGRHATVWCNEEGLLHKMHSNLTATLIWHAFVSPDFGTLVGPVVIVQRA